MDITSSFRQLAQQAASAPSAQQAGARAAQSTSARTAQSARARNAAVSVLDEKPGPRPDSLLPRRIDFSRPAGNVFLSEAYIIARHLQSLRRRILDIRPAYLNLPKSGRHRRGPAERAGGRLSDPERDEIDRGIKTAVREVLAKIQSLGEMGEVLLDAMPSDESAGELFRRFVGALDPRKAGSSGGVQAAGALNEATGRLGRRDTAAAQQSSVVWWLNSRLRQTNQIHAEMQEEYLCQKLERQRGLLQQQRPAAAAAASPASGARPEQDELLQSLSEQQLQQLRTENDSMLHEFESTLDQIRETQRSVAEISALQIQLASELDAQMQQTEQLYDEAVGAVGAVGQGNEYLVSAYKNKASARKWVLFIFIALSVVLLFLDWFD
ncbi:hypothetical protein LPJ61_004707 [Coemansia biformis]|uniref:SNARE-complex protein Syntaxin-18 N-terminal domain-containing protein n=1 Tax=Coemansia biformis TaxID=1286918 RepID=A0A9W7Y4C6_9FUNG|nr:hypothetical protein LPJ61_004707 [Coemansia biformis]